MTEPRVAKKNQNCRDIFNMLFYTHPNTNKTCIKEQYLKDLDETVGCDRFINLHWYRKNGIIPDRNRLRFAYYSTFTKD